MLVRAFRLVRDAKMARLLILGEGPDRSRIKGTIGELSSTMMSRFPALRAIPIASWTQATVFALSSAWEGFGVVLE